MISGVELFGLVLMLGFILVVFGALTWWIKKLLKWQIDYQRKEEEKCQKGR